jgi:hypothetical protein
LEIRRAGRMAVRADRKRVPPFFTGLQSEVPEVVDFPGVGNLRHFNVATQTANQSIQEAVAQSLNNLPEGVGTVVLLGSTANPRSNDRIVVYIGS